MTYQRFLVFCLVALLLFPLQVFAAVTTNVIASGNTGGSAAASLTINATIASGSNTSVYVCVADNAGNLGTMSTVAWNTSESLTKIVEVDAGDTWGTSLWRLKAPTTGAHSIVITPSASVNMAAAVIVLDGVDQTTSERTQSTAILTDNTGTGVTVTVVNSQNGDYVLDCVGRRQLENDVMTAGAGQTELAQNRANGFNDVGVLASTEAATGANTVMSWGYDGINLSYATIGIPLIPASGGGGPACVRSMMLMGVGC